MTTRKKTARVKKEIIERPIDYEGHDVEEVVQEVVIEKSIPQTYQCTVFSKKGGPHEPLDVVGHIQYSDSTGLLRAIPNPKYDSDLLNFISSGIIVKGNPDIYFSPRNKSWITNVHKAELPKYWTIEEARTSNEI